MKPGGKMVDSAELMPDEPLPPTLLAGQPGCHRCAVMQSSAAAPMAACAEPGYMSVATPSVMPPWGVEQYSSMASAILPASQPVMAATRSRS